MKILVLVQLFFQLVLFTSACTEVRVTSVDNSVIVGRSMEHMLHPMSHIIVEPMKSSHTARLKPENCKKPITWEHKYTVAYMDSLNLPIILGGMNNAGLSVSALMFPGFARYQEVPDDKCATAVSSLEFTLWLLGNFATVKDLRADMEKDTFPLVFAGNLVLDYSFDEHYSVTDKTGEGIVIEFTENGRMVHDNTVGAVTNAPPYDFHMLNLRNYVSLSKYAHDVLMLGETPFRPTGEGSGLLGMPGDMTPTSRFVRAAILANFAARAKTSKEAVKMAYHILNTVDIPHGVISDHKHEGFADYTSWAVAKDLSNNALYFRTYEDLTIRVVYLDNVEPAGRKLKIKMESLTDGFKDVTGEMAPAEAHTEL